MNNRITAANLTQADALAYMGRNYDIAVGVDADLTGIGSVGYGYFSNRRSGLYDLQHYFSLKYYCAYERVITESGNTKNWTKLIATSDLGNRMIFEFVPLNTDEDVKAYYKALPINTIRFDYNYNGKEYTYIFSKSTDLNGNVMRIASSGGTLEIRYILNGTWSDWMAK